MSEVVDLEKKLNSNSIRREAFDLDGALKELNIRQRTVFDIELERALRNPEWYINNGLNREDSKIKTKAEKIIYKDLFETDHHFTPYPSGKKFF